MWSVLCHLIFSYLFCRSDQNGVDEPESKRRRESESEGPEEDGKPRRMRRTVDMDLLFAFTFFDSGHSSFVRDYDLADILQLLNLGYTKSQVRHLLFLLPPLN